MVLQKSLNWVWAMRYLDASYYLAENGHIELARVVIILYLRPWLPDLEVRLTKPTKAYIKECQKLLDKEVVKKSISKTSNKIYTCARCLVDGYGSNILPEVS